MRDNIDIPCLYDLNPSPRCGAGRGSRACRSMRRRLCTSELRMPDRIAAAAAGAAVFLLPWAEEPGAHRWEALRSVRSNFFSIHRAGA